MNLGRLERLHHLLRQKLGADDDDVERARAALPSLLGWILNGREPADPEALVLAGEAVLDGANLLPDDPRDVDLGALEVAFTRGLDRVPGGWCYEGPKADPCPPRWRPIRDAVAELAAGIGAALPAPPEPSSGWSMR